MTVTQPPNQQILKCLLPLIIGSMKWCHHDGADVIVGFQPLAIIHRLGIYHICILGTRCSWLKHLDRYANARLKGPID